MSNRTSTSHNRIILPDNLDKNEKIEDKVDENKTDFRVVNELKEGNFFGEVGLLTNLKRTCSIFTIS